LRLVILIQSNRALYANNCSIACASDQVLIGPKNSRAVSRPDRTHRQNLAVDEFHAIVLRQDTGIDHSVIILNREESF
jgi:hypothetical protein